MPNSCLIFGLPRSGTSLTAGMCAAAAQYYVGKQPLKPTISNPKGYFEDAAINAINNSLIHCMLRWPVCESIRLKFAKPQHRDARLYPSAAFNRVPSIAIPPDILSKMRNATSSTPFLFKDPRFSATWRYWAPLLPADTKYLIVFREPEKIAQSYVLNAERIYDFKLDPRWPLHSFTVTYGRLLREFQNDRKAMFVHYEHVYSGERLPEIGELLDVSLPSADAADPQLRRSDGILPDSQELRRAHKIYTDLCRVAEFDCMEIRTPPRVGDISS